MAKISDHYEVVYIIDPMLSEEDTAALVEPSSRRWQSRTVPLSRSRSGASASWPTRSTTGPRATMC